MTPEPATNAAPTTSLRLCRALAAVASVLLLAAGLLGAARVDFSQGFLRTSGGVAGFGFTPVVAVVAILLGGMAAVTTLADQDRTGSLVVGVLTLLVGAALIAFDGWADGVDLDEATGVLFLIVGAMVTCLALVPRRSRGRRRAVAERQG